MVAQQNNLSEIARIRAAIKMECQALNNLTAFTRTGSHDIINAKYKALDVYHQELRAILGDDEATSTIVAIYTDTIQ